MAHTITASVIILGYNGKGFLAECLASVLDQSYPAEDYEVICVDNVEIAGLDRETQNAGEPFARRVVGSKERKI
jgi:GT2 family glycosyltransferase